VYPEIFIIELNETCKVILVLALAFILYLAGGQYYYYVAQACPCRQAGDTPNQVAINRKSARLNCAKLNS